MEQKCIVCGDTFDAKNAKAQFCKASCRVANNRNNKKNALLSDSKSSENVTISVELPAVKHKNKKDVTDNNEKIKALRSVMEKIDKDYGKGTARTLGDIKLEVVDAIPTGSISLNKAIGVGGIPRGKITEIFGMQSSGKTTITLHIIKEAQKMGISCLFIDVEHAFDVEYANAIGVDTDNLLFLQPDNAEQALEVMDRYISSGAIGLVVLDSVAALVPRVELEGEMGDYKMGVIARLMGQACRKLTSSASRTQTACIFINQLRTDINIKFGNPNVPCGGNSLKFFSSLRLEVSKKEIKDGDEMIGSKVKVKVIKNKVAPPFKIAEFDIFYGEGINRINEIVDMAITEGIIKQSGAWFYYEEHKFQGKDNVLDFIASHEIIAEEIEKILISKKDTTTLP